MRPVLRFCFLGLMTAPLASAVAADESDLLSQLTFKNSGVVRRGMRFEYKMQPCFYVESPTAWTVADSPAGGPSNPYLWRVDGSGNSRRFSPPPVGMRSAVPLGGLGAGTVELRADGSFRDWNIFNNSPGGGGGKVQLDEALFGLRIGGEGQPAKAWALRTHPPQGLPAIDEIEYSGAFPVSRLRFRDPDLPVGVDSYAYSTFKIRDARASAAPAVAFSFVLSNPTAKPVEAAIFFNLPNHLGGVISSSGQTGLCIERAGSDSTSGSMVVRFGDGSARSCAAGNDLPAVWRAFQAHGCLTDGKTLPRGAAKQASIASRVVLEPGQRRTINLALAWYLPNRMHAGQRVGNYYTRLYRGAADVAERVLSRLAENRQSILEWQRLCFDNSLPEWLQDALLNSVATMAKTGMWIEDGRWRQWESFSCSALEPVHIYFYRSLPYMLFFPQLSQSQFRGFASIQKPDGFINEDLGNSGRPIDNSQARDMGDCTSTFILGVYNHYLWTADRRFLDELWPAARKAAQWQIGRSRSFGLPARLNNTYDWWAFQDKDVVAYNAVLHLAALEAADRLAEIKGDADFARHCRQSIASGQKTR